MKSSSVGPRARRGMTIAGGSSSPWDFSWPGLPEEGGGVSGDPEEDTPREASGAGSPRGAAGPRVWESCCRRAREDCDASVDARAVAQGPAPVKPMRGQRNTAKMMVLRKSVRKPYSPRPKVHESALCPLSEVHSKIHQKLAVPKDREHALLAERVRASQNATNSIWLTADLLGTLTRTKNSADGWV